MNTELIPEVLPDDKPLPFWDHIGELLRLLARLDARHFESSNARTITGSYENRWMRQGPSRSSASI